MKKIKLSQIKPNPDNPRQISEKNMEKLKKSIQDFKKMLEIRPIIYDENNIILGGNMRYQALLKLGYKEAPESWFKCATDLTEDEKRQFVITDNGSFGDWDFDILANGWDDLPLDDWGIDLPEGWLNVEKEGLIDPNEVPDVQDEPTTQTGDLYQLGNHRLLCGDSTKLEDVERLMNGEKADMVFTDPPYGVSYGDKNKFLNAVGRGNCIQENIKNDTLSPEESFKLWIGCFTQMYGVIKNGASFYICSADADLMMMMMAIRDSGLKMKQSLVWVKNNIVLGRRDYKSQHENILYGWKKTHKFYGKSGERSVWNFYKPHSSKLHPTMKPVELVIHAIENSSKMEDLLYEPFCGSGTTIIACEQTNRICYGMEIDPHYCDVIIKRWEDFTGKKAVKL